ncbi:hypothetical protein AKJ51_00535 [candidate division MSBL1 archaeon SCGC-AAA382A20]|uniref:Uncharacterized protein n=1 Tax=candidate division MSBL1 archaeon SCGC-AAA382A20 TaxID=1698280 RepID=A0A133VMI5_9EURY|nr:hypothetical protein AKJ51_00535 [candidate division MSBL1 archaeon SCGC-AAA382A20]
MRFSSLLSKVEKSNVGNLPIDKLLFNEGFRYYAGILVAFLKSFDLVVTYFFYVLLGGNAFSHCEINPVISLAARFGGIWIILYNLIVLFGLVYLTQIRNRFGRLFSLALGVFCFLGALNWFIPYF